MVIQNFDSVLDDCIAALQRGESVEWCLDRYPRHADRLRPLLQLAAKVRKTPPQPPRPWPQANAWQRVRQRADELRTPQPRSVPQVRIPLAAWLRPIAVTVAVLAALFATVGGTALAAQNALPDSPLYRVKLATEEVRLVLVFDDTRKAEILIDQSDERMEEILTMTRQDKAIPGNVLSALRSRNERAADILADQPEETDLRNTLVQQSAAQEGNLILLFPEVSDSARPEYTEAVAAVHNARLGPDEGFGVQPEELAQGVLHISGSATPVTENLWNVGGLDVTVDATTIKEAELQPGDTARLVVGKNSRGQLRALTLQTVATDLPPSGSVVSGQIEQVTDKGIVIGGQLIPFTDQTLRTGRVRAGQRVEVTLGKSDTGTVAETVRPVPTPVPGGPQVAPTPFTFEGVIEGDIKKSNEWKIGGLTFVITANTNVDARAGEAKDGARALVEASVQDGRLLAESVSVLAADAAPDSAYLVGTFEQSDEGVWSVSGVQVVPPVRDAEPAPGTVFALDLRRHGNDLEVQLAIVTEKPEDTGLVRLTGIITELDGARWTLDFGTVRVASTADVSGPEPVVGARALVWGRPNQNGVFEASYARVLDKTAIVATPAPAEPEPTTPPVGTAGP